MDNIPILVILLFVAATFLTTWIFYIASGKSKIIAIYLLAWMILQAIISISGFYEVSDGTPPRFIILIGPGILITILLFKTRVGKNFVDSLNLKSLTLLHSIRIPVEITLYFVYMSGLIPVLMTFEGNNFDIFSGLTAPMIFYLVFVIKRLDKTYLLVWNFMCLGLLINVLAIAILSAQTPFQKLAFEQPNLGVTLFPFTWLPSVIVPLVLISHLSAIRQIITSKNKSTLPVKLT